MPNDCGVFDLDQGFDDLAQWPLSGVNVAAARGRYRGCQCRYSGIVFGAVVVVNNRASLSLEIVELTISE
jgi:hypothetical protein